MYFPISQMMTRKIASSTKNVPLGSRKIDEVSTANYLAEKT